ncbi:MAG: DUF4091 domain-containing protein [Candidatus Hydrogenedentes bacterium]|nr:DUF4091 domain-containing protein [Candidatus Hydrogenedentota bacterium]
MRIVAALCLAGTALSAGASVIEKDEVHIEGKYLKMLLAPGGGGAVQEFGLLGAQGDVAAGDGMFLEGFGTDSAYVPNRRLNEKLEAVEEIKDRPVLRYSYDCDGPNINGLHVTRTLEPLPDEASVRVHWTIENRGKEEQWVSPWVRNEVAPGGTLDANDRVDVPAFDGVHAAERNGYYPAARNWIAATDPAKRESVYGVFDADQTLAFLAVRSMERKACAMQAAFVPRLIKPGESWETTYRVNMARTLTHVDFATDQLAAQIDYKPGGLDLTLSSVKVYRDVKIEASVRAADGQVWRLTPQTFDLAPEKGAKCAFEWTAPADGAYDFMAKLSSGGKPLELGKETASPHGGIDTQFVAGKPAHVAFEAWTDAPFTLQRGTRTLKRALAAPGDTAIWIESSLEKIYPDDIPESAGAVNSIARVALARNEHESFQVVLRPPKELDLEDVKITCGDLVGSERGNKIAARNVEIASVGYVPVDVPTHLEGPTGPCPDILAPYAPATLRGGKSQPVWFTVFAPAETPAGVYRGTITIEGATADLVSLTLEVTVFNLDLPVTSALKTDFGITFDTALDWAKKGGYSGTAQQLKDAYVTNALQHRVTLRELCALPAEAADYAAALRNYEPRLKELLRKGATTISVPVSLMAAPELVKQADAFVVKNGLKGRAFCAFAEEPPQPAWPRLSENLQRWMDSAPNIPSMVTSSGVQPFLPGGLPIWGVHAQMLDTVNGKPILDRIKENREVWWYVNSAPPRPYANFFLDYAAIDHRMLFWQTWALGIQGLHYWSVNHLEPGQDPRQSLLTMTPANGDGFLVYPGADGPVNSIRWETIRDGIEDYDYLAMLTARIRKLEAAGSHEELHKRARAVYNLQALIPSLVTFTRDPKLLETKRRDIAQMIVEIDKALGSK